MLKGLIYIYIYILYINILNVLLSTLVFRPPDTDINTFNNIANKILTLIQSKNKTAIRIGDFNINLLNVDKHAPTAEFIEFMYSYSYFRLINKHGLYTDNSTHFPFLAVFKNKIYEPPVQTFKVNVKFSVKEILVDLYPN